MKHGDEDEEIAALNAQVSEIYKALPKHKPSDRILSKKEQLDMKRSASLKRSRGRPSLGDGNSQRTIDSFDAFLFVQSEMQGYRRRIGKKHVSKTARDKFIEIAKTICPQACTEIILEHLRKSNAMNIAGEFKVRNWRGVNDDEGNET